MSSTITYSTPVWSSSSYVSNWTRESNARKHWSIYWLIIVIAISVLSGRVLTLRNPDTKGESPFFSANDRSRWCTVRSLVDFGTFEIDDVIREKSDIHWDTIDKVQHIGTDGQLHFYSSKPPLLSVIVAGQYWAIKQVTGWRLDQQPVWIARIVLLGSIVQATGTFWRRS